MLCTIYKEDENLHPEIMNQVYALRARVFHDRLAWSVNVSSGQEHDRYDKLDPLHIISITEHDKVNGYLRLLPTTGPYMLADTFPELLGDEAPPRSPLIWESSRFCVDTKNEDHRIQSSARKITGELLLGLFSIAHAANIEFVVSVFDLAMERILRRSGCIFDRIGRPYIFGNGLKTTAAVFEVSDKAIDSIKKHTQQFNLILNSSKSSVLPKVA